jgi:hypothetical protein
MVVDHHLIADDFLNGCEIRVKTELLGFLGAFELEAFIKNTQYHLLEKLPR